MKQVKMEKRTKVMLSLLVAVFPELVSGSNESKTPELLPAPLPLASPLPERSLIDHMQFKVANQLLKSALELPAHVVPTYSETISSPPAERRSDWWSEEPLQERIRKLPNMDHTNYVEDDYEYEYIDTDNEFQREEEKRFKRKPDQPLPDEIFYPTDHQNRFRPEPPRGRPNQNRFRPEPPRLRPSRERYRTNQGFRPGKAGPSSPVRAVRRPHRHRPPRQSGRGHEHYSKKRIRPPERRRPSPYPPQSINFVGHLTKKLQGALASAFHGARRNSIYPRIQYGPLKFGPPLRSLSKTDLEQLELEQIEPEPYRKRQRYRRPHSGEEWDSFKAQPEENWIHQSEDQGLWDSQHGDRRDEQRGYWQQGDRRDDGQQGDQRTDWHEGDQRDDWQQGDQRDDWHQEDQRDDWHQGDQRNDWHQGDQRNDWQQGDQRNDWQQGDQRDDWQQGDERDEWHQGDEMDYWPEQTTARSENLLTVQRPSSEMKERLPPQTFDQESTSGTSLNNKGRKTVAPLSSSKRDQKDRGRNRNHNWGAKRRKPYRREEESYRRDGDSFGKDEEYIDKLEDEDYEEEEYDGLSMDYWQEEGEDKEKPDYKDRWKNLGNPTGPLIMRQKVWGEHEGDMVGGDWWKNQNRRTFKVDQTSRNDFIDDSAKIRTNGIEVADVNELYLQQQNKMKKRKILGGFRRSTKNRLDKDQKTSKSSSFQPSDVDVINTEVLNPTHDKFNNLKNHDLGQKSNYDKKMIIELENKVGEYDDKMIIKAESGDKYDDKMIIKPKKDRTYDDNLIIKPKNKRRTVMKTLKIRRPVGFVRKQSNKRRTLIGEKDLAKPVLKTLQAIAFSGKS